MSSNITVTRVCQHCGREFTARKTTTRYCTHHCARRAYKARIRGQKIEARDRETARAKLPAGLAERHYLSVAQAATLTGLSRWTIARMINRGQLPKGKAGSRTILRRADLDRALFLTH